MKRPNWFVVAFLVGISAAILYAQATVIRTTAGTEAGTSASPWRIDPTGTTTQPVSFTTPIAVTGTFFQSTQPVSFTNGITFSSTQPVSFAIPTSWPLSTGASTETTLSNVLTAVQRIPASPATTGTQPVNLAQYGGTTIGWTDPCTYLRPTTVPISQTGTTLVISSAASKFNYICGGLIVAATSEIINFVEGQGTTCGTSSAALVGSVTPANGPSFGNNQGFVVPRTIVGIGTAINTCLTQSGSSRVSGYITTVQAVQ